MVAIRVDGYRISNTSLHEAIEPHNLCKRFEKPHESDEASNGLGLAIIKKIAETNRLQIAYKHEDGSHHFEISRR